MQFATRAIHAGQEADPATGATVVPIYQTATYTQEGIGRNKGYEYARTANPTRAALEACLASLEGARFGLAFGSGMAAETAVMHLAACGDHIVAAEDLYGGTYRLFEQVGRRCGIDFTYVDASNPEAIRMALRPSTRLVWVETPTNPLVRLVNITAAAEAAHSGGALLVVDNTFLSPALQNPLSLGADIVVHSTTKYLGGHSDVVGGAALTHSEDLWSALKRFENTAGGIPGPFDCWLVLRGLKTLKVRMEAHSANALGVARFLEGHPAVARVHYPGLESHPQHALALRQQRGFGGMLSVELQGGGEAALRALERFRLFSLAESLGGVESLVGYPATMSHAGMPTEERHRRGITDGLIRLSVGIEDLEDLLADLEQALSPAL